MENSDISWLGEVTAKAAKRALQKADQVGIDQNRGQFVRMVEEALLLIPDDLRGDYVKDFLANEAKYPYGKRSE